tara:strand:- start:83 stop:268 length:186 start_codon:yes stop_codon:yes gene_type:complete
MATGNPIATGILERALVHLRANQPEQFASLLRILLAGHPHVVVEVHAVLIGELTSSHAPIA